MLAEMPSTRRHPGTGPFVERASTGVLWRVFSPAGAGMATAGARVSQGVAQAEPAAGREGRGGMRARP